MLSSVHEYVKPPPRAPWRRPAWHPSEHGRAPRGPPPRNTGTTHCTHGRPRVVHVVPPGGQYRYISNKPEGRHFPLVELVRCALRVSLLAFISNKHMWLNTSMRLLSLITLLTYLQNHELHMLIVWQYHKHTETLQRTRKSGIAEPPCNKEKIRQ